MQILESFGESVSYPASWYLVCPKCGMDCTHLKHSTLFFRHGEDSKKGFRIHSDGNTIAIGTDTENDNPSVRRDGISLVFTCESGCVFRLDIFQHKGPTYFEVQFIGDDPGHPRNAAHP